MLVDSISLEFRKSSPLMAPYNFVGHHGIRVVGKGIEKNEKLESFKLVSMKFEGFRFNWRVTSEVGIIVLK